MHQHYGDTVDWRLVAHCSHTAFLQAACSAVYPYHTWYLHSRPARSRKAPDLQHDRCHSRHSKSASESDDLELFGHEACLGYSLQFSGYRSESLYGSSLRLPELQARLPPRPTLVDGVLSIVRKRPEVV